MPVLSPFAVHWDAPEFAYRAKGPAWYWISIVVATLILATAVWQRNYFFAVFVLIAEILVIVWAARAPRTVTFTLSEKGLTIDGKKNYSLQDLQSFSIYERADNQWQIIAFRFARRLRLPLRVMVAVKDAQNVTTALARAVPEVTEDESFIDILEEFLRF